MTIKIEGEKLVQIIEGQIQEVRIRHNCLRSSFAIHTEEDIQVTVSISKEIDAFIPAENLYTQKEDDENKDA